MVRSILQRVAAQKQGAGYSCGASFVRSERCATHDSREAATFTANGSVPNASRRISDAQSSRRAGKFPATVLA